MGLSPAAVLAGAWARFGRDRALLLALAGPFWLLPSAALRLLVPLPPPLPVGFERGSAEATAAFQALFDWAGAHGGWYAVAGAIGYWGTLTVFDLYLDPARPTVAAALRRAGALWPRFFLLNLVTAFPVALGLWLLFVPGLIVLARVLAAGPALVAEAPVGAWAAIRRGVTMSRGFTLPLMALAATPLALALLGEPLFMLERWLREQPGGPNPVALVIVDLMVAGVSTVVALTGALIAVEVYRRLASRGV